MDLPAKSLFPNSLTDADIATNIVVHALKQGRGKSRKSKKRINTLLSILSVVVAEAGLEHATSRL